MTQPLDPTIAPGPSGPPDPVGPARRRRWAVVMTALLVAAGVALLVVALRPSPERAGVDHEYVVPAGTGARLDAGEHVEVIPNRLELLVNDRLVVRNDDSRDHIVGPFAVRAGETVRYRFSRKGTFIGACTIHPSGDLAITVR